MKKVLFKSHRIAPVGNFYNDFFFVNSTVSIIGKKGDNNMKNNKSLKIEVLENGMRYLEVSDGSIRFCFEYNPQDIRMSTMAQECISSIFTEEELYSLFNLIEES